MTRRIATTRRHAFTILELLAAITILSIIAVTAIPAWSHASEARIASVADRVEMAALQARSCAINTGIPHGLQVTTTSIQPLYIPNGAAPIATRDGMNQATPSITFTEETPGVIKSCVSGDGTTTFPFTIWFSHDGVPQLRNSSGTLIGNATYDVIINVGSSSDSDVRSSIRIRKISGEIELN
ncbi:MAG: prepilin-type N-terminal cleavage/methylation domain-containing protein [Phycisphaerales bacterium]